MKRKLLTSLTVLTSIGIAATACTGPNSTKEQIAMRLASPAWLIKRSITAEPFTLTAFERMHTKGQTANIYIEGDGDINFARNAISEAEITASPTPTNPIALHLAAFDKAENLAYIARPCQFTGMSNPDEECTSNYWREGSFAPEVISAYNTALDKMKNRYSLTGYNLIGHGGGAAIAALLTAQRDDVKSLRTVAGILDTSDKYTESLNPIDFVNDLRDIPQIHYTGNWDEDVSSDHIHTYLAALGADSCALHIEVTDAEHKEGWVNQWSDLHGTPLPDCSPKAPAEAAFEPINPPAPIYYPRMDASKK
ncbi:MAG: hypothetical protein ACRBCT_04265 [Alphaproteobacteria bacterium]